MFKKLGLITSIILTGMSIRNTSESLDCPEAPVIKNIDVNLSDFKNPVITLDYASSIMDKNIISASGYNDDKSVNLIYNGKSGKQELSSESPYEGVSSYKITDTISNREGNDYGFPDTDSEVSRHFFEKRFYIPQGTNISYNIKLKGEGTKGYFKITSNGGWEAGRFASFPTVHVTSKALKGEKEIYVDDITPWKPDSNDKATKWRSGFTTDTNPNDVNFVTYVDKAIKTDENSTSGKIILSSALNRDLEIGETIKYKAWGGHWSFSSPIPMNQISSEWTTFSRNTVIPKNVYYNDETRGNILLGFVSTDGVIEADDFVAGYANKIKLMRDNTEIYEGYDLTFKDTGAKDVASPNTIESIQGNIVLKDSTKNLIKVNFTAPEDNGTDYTYTAIASFDDNESPVSKPEKVNIKTGIDGYSYVIDNNPSTIPDNTIDTRDTTIEKEVPRDDKVYYIHLKSIDKAGNISDTVHQKIETHRTDLIVSESSAGVELNWSFSDSNVNNYYFKIFRKEENNEFIELVSNEKNISYIDNSAADNTKPQMPSIDTSKYNESTNSFEYTIEPPVDDGTEYSYYIEAYLNNGDKVSTSNTASINIKSGIKGVSYILDTNSNSTPDNNIDIIDKIIAPVSNSGQFLHIKAIDNNDNASDILHFKAFDDENPSLDLRLTDYYPTNKDVTIVVTGNDNMGIDYILLPNGEKVYSKTVNYTVSQDGSYTFLVCDIAGNTTTKTIDITNIDKDVDGVEITKSKNIFTKDNITIKIRVNDKSGVNYIILPNGNKVFDNSVDYEVEEDGVYNFTIRDNAGNEKIYSVTVDNIDKIFPSITVIKNDNWTNGPIEININTRD